MFCDWGDPHCPCPPCSTALSSAVGDGTIADQWMITRNERMTNRAVALFCSIKLYPAVRSILPFCRRRIGEGRRGGLGTPDRPRRCNPFAAPSLSHCGCVFASFAPQPFLSVLATAALLRAFTLHLLRAPHSARDNSSRFHPRYQEFGLPMQTH